MHRGKVDPGVSELPRGNELSRDHVNRPYVKKEIVHGCERIFEDFDDCVVLKMNKNVFSLERD